MSNATNEALGWVVQLLQDNNIPYQISGGFAAKMYGSSRKLNDIDFDIPEDKFDVIYPQVKSYLTYGPGRYIDKKWDTYLMTLNYKGQEIDISGAFTTYITSKDRNKKLLLPCDFEKNIQMNIEGLTINVMHPRNLIAYKKHLDGNHQLIDIKATSQFIQAHDL